jgi:mono/diheme cytochrome c family protein
MGETDGSAGSDSSDGSTGSSSTTGAASDSQGSDGSSGGDETTGDAATTGNSDASGEELYALCAPCHGATGEGSDLGYELRHPTTRAYATWVVRNGRPGTEFTNSVMAPYSEAVLSDADLEKIWDYLDSFDQPTTGEELYLDYCGNCHGPDGTGGVVGVSVLGELGELFDIVRSGEGGTNYANRPGYMTAFGTDRLTDEEVQAILDFFAG